ncbi:MAG: Gfo/Idh/MocA family oxidoreductase [Eubacteriales bacterium]
MGLKIGIVGCGQFGCRFIDIYKNHPLVEEVVLADSVKDRAITAGEKYGITKIYGGLDEVLETDIDAVCIFTQRQLHGPMAIQALKAGKHVCCAVPMATDVEDVKEIIRLVEETGLIYMTNETSYYYPNTIFCRERYKKGEFGEFTFADAQYVHDMSHFYEPYKHSGGPNWKRIAGFPPMFYPTHSVSMVLSVTEAHVTKVSCMGFEDHHEDGIFGEELNDFGNPFSNETALMQTSDGGCCRINEFRRVVPHDGGGEVSMSFMGTNASYASGVRSYYTKRDQKTEDISEEVTCIQGNLREEEDNLIRDEVLKKDFYSGTAPIHPIQRLPETFHAVPNGHEGSHQFLTDDFCKAVNTKKLPPNDAWAGARFCVPGLIAHESAMKGGILLDVPYFGEAPKNWERIE